MDLLPYHSRGMLEAGCDEAGRGCLAGPVSAAAVILPPDFHLPGLNDSKQLSEPGREVLAHLIREQALAWSVVMVPPDEIDRYNILQASITGMHRAIDRLGLSPDAILVDGNRFRPYRDIPHKCFVKGDGKYASIAAASILAKTARDALMKELHVTFPDYAWDRNKGYPTAAHRLAIQAHGITQHHRTSFRLYPQKALRTGMFDR